MKIALVVHDFNASFGQGRYCVELVRHLHPRARFTVYSNTYQGTAPPNTTWQRVACNRANALTTVFSFIPAAERLLRRDRPDLIHAQGLTGWSADIITGHICNAARRERLRATERRALLFIKLVTPFERAFYRQGRARRLIAISRSLADEIRSKYGWKKPVDIIYHGTNVDDFRPPADDLERARLRREYGLPPNRWTWLFMGEALKGLADVIEQLPAFPQAHLLVVTRSDLPPFRSQAAALGVGDRIRFHGFASHPEQAFRAVDVFVYPNDYDPFGMVATEAMATALPVILGHTIGAAELVEHGHNGLLCEPHHAPSIHAQLSRLAADSGFGREMGARARQTVEKHTWKVCAEETWSAYKRLLEEKHAA